MQIAYAFNTFVRILWIIIIAILCGVGVYFAYDTIKTFLSYPMDVVTSLNYDTQVGEQGLDALIGLSIFLGFPGSNLVQSEPLQLLHC